MSAPHPSDVVAQQTFLGVDDIQFRKEKARRSAPKEPPPEIPDGPCCARCAGWVPPAKGDAFGLCREVVYEPTASPDSWVMLTRREAEAQFLFGTEPMPVKGYAEGCSLYRANGGQ